MSRRVPLVRNALLVLLGIGILRLSLAGMLSPARGDELSSASPTSQPTAIRPPRSIVQIKSNRLGPIEDTAAPGKSPVVAAGRDEHVQIVDPAKRAASEKAYLEVAKNLAGRAIAREDMIKIYAASDYGTVKSLIQEKVISEIHSLQMADLRAMMMLEVMRDVCKKNAWEAYRSDSGNQTAGMTSDIDQTVIVFKVLEDGSRIRHEQGDAEFARLTHAEFNSRYAKYGFTTAHIDVATIPSRDNFPHWLVTSEQLDAQQKRPVGLHMAQSMVELRDTPGAYTYCGPVVKQMQMRVLEGLHKQLGLGPSLQMAPDPRSDPLPQGLIDLGVTNRNMLLCTRIGPDDKGDYKVNEVMQEEAIRVMFDGVAPILVRGHAYDSAVANYIEFMHHLHDKYPAVKYFLRPLNDGILIIKTLEGKVPPALRKDYEKLKGAEREAHLANLLGPDIAAKRLRQRHRASASSLLDRWKVCFDIAAEMRQLHNQQKLNEKTSEEALRPLALEFCGEDDDPNTWRKYLPLAREEFNRRCQEFLLHNMINESKERISDWLTNDPNNPEHRARLEALVDEGTMRKLIDPEGKFNDEKWSQVREEIFRNYSEIARVQLIFSFREIPEPVLKLIREMAATSTVGGVAPPTGDIAGPRHDPGARPRYTKEELAKLDKLMAEAQDAKWAEKLFSNYPELYKEIYRREALKAKSKTQAERAAWLTGAQEHVKSMVLSHVGLHGPDPGAKPSEFLRKVGLGGLDSGMHAYFQNNRMAGITSRIVRSSVLDWGNAMVLVDVARAYSESHGDPEAVRQAVFMQLITMWPIVGPAVNLYFAEDWTSRGIAIAGLFVPGVGAVQCAFALGEGGLVIYEHNFIKPVANGIADAVYRGFVGPTLRDFGPEVRQFTKEDAKKLAGLQERIKTLRETTQPGSAAEEELNKKLSEENSLLRMQNEWEAYDKEQKDREFYGQTSQKILELGSVPGVADTPLNTAGSLLARVKPYVFYSPSTQHGDVDFTIPALTADQLKRKAALDGLINAESDPMEACRLEEELANLTEQNEAHARAQRYLEQAKTSPELMLAIRCDSLWPSMTHEEPPFQDMVNTDQFVKDWLALRIDILPPALQKIGIGDGTRRQSDAFQQARDHLMARLREDMERSKKLWLIRQDVRTRMKVAEKTRLERRQTIYANQMLADAAVDPPVRFSENTQQVLKAADIDPTDVVRLSALSQALIRRHVPESPPSVEIGFIQALDENERPELRPEVKVSANPEIYVPPYQSVSYQLAPDEVRSAVSSKQFEGLPLDESTIDALKPYVQGLDEAGNAASQPAASVGDDRLESPPAILTFVFCKDVRIPQRVISETVAHLPRLTKHAIPMPAGMKGPPRDASAGFLTEGYLFGSAAHAPVSPPSSPLQVVTRRRDGERPATLIEITSDALEPGAQSEYRRLHFLVTRGTSPNGPFDEAFHSGPVEVRRPDVPTILDDSLGVNRLGTNKIQLEDTFSSPSGRVPQRGPFFYQVIQEVRDKAGKQVGDVVKSNVAGPNGRAMLWIAQEKLDQNGRVIIKARGDHLEFRVGIGLEDQCCDLCETEIIAESHGWTGHFWTSRREGKREFGEVPSGGSIYWAVTRLKIPVVADAAGQKIRLRVNSGSFLAERDVTIAPDAERLKLWKDRISEDRQRYQTQLDEARNKLAKYKDLAVAARKDLASAVAPKTWREADRKRAFTWQVADSKFECDMLERYELPKKESELARDVARMGGQWKDALALVEKETEWVALSDALVKHRNEDFLRIIDWFVSLDYVEQVHKDVNQDMTKSKISSDTRYDKEVRTKLAQDREDLALKAGEVKAYRQATADLIRLETKHGASPHYIGETLMDHAGGIATLTGDRQEATSLWRRGMDMALSMRPPELRAKKREEYETRDLPEWLLGVDATTPPVDFTAWLDANVSKPAPDGSRPDAPGDRAARDATTPRENAPKVAGTDAPPLPAGRIETPAEGESGTPPAATASRAVPSAAGNAVTAASQPAASQAPSVAQAPPASSKSESAAAVPSNRANSPATPNQPASDAKPVTQSLAAPSLAKPGSTFVPSPRRSSPAYDQLIAGKFNEAIVSATAALKKSPRDEDALVTRGHAYLNSNRLKESLMDFRSLSTAHPGVPAYRAVQAVGELLAGDKRVARVIAEELIKSDPQVADYHLLHGEAAMLMGQNATASESFKTAVRLNPQLPAEVRSKGDNYLNKGVPEAASLMYSTALFMDVSDVSPFIGLGAAREKLGDKEQAMRAYERYLRFDPNGQHASKARQELARLKGHTP